MTNSPKILIVEDSKDIRDLLEFVFQEKGFHVECAEDGLDAHDNKALREFDMFLMDLQMPNMDGKQLLTRLRKDMEIDKPVLFFTSHASDQTIAELKEAGANKIINKPARAHKLVEEVSALLEAH
ncbi:MAG: response regulator transcription factor [Acidiferrobacterales bacterium]|nr:response regulator transcription factor [Acidiferrobacterales bacterium]